MKKRLILISILIIFVISFASLVSAGLCRGSDGYYYDCGYNYKPKAYYYDKPKVFNGPYTDYIVKKADYVNRRKTRYHDYYDRDYIVYSRPTYYKLTHSSSYYPRRGHTFGGGYYKPYFSDGYYSEFEGGYYTSYSKSYYPRQYSVEVYW